MLCSADASRPARSTAARAAKGRVLQRSVCRGRLMVLQPALGLRAPAGRSAVPASQRARLQPQCPAAAACRCQHRRGSLPACCCRVARCRSPAPLSRRNPALHRLSCTAGRQMQAGTSSTPHQAHPAPGDPTAPALPAPPAAAPGCVPGSEKLRVPRQRCKPGQHLHHMDMIRILLCGRQRPAAAAVRCGTVIETARETGS